MTTAPAGWYPDPAEGAEDTERYWDGAAWTEQTRPVAVPSASPPPAPDPFGPPATPGMPAQPAAPASPASPTQPAASGTGTGRRSVILLAVAAMALFAAVGGAAAIVLLNSDDDEADVETVADGDDGETSNQDSGENLVTDDTDGTEDAGDLFDGAFGDDGGLGTVGERFGPDACRFHRLDFADDIQVLLAVVNPGGAAGALNVTYALSLPDGTRFATGFEHIDTPSEGEQFFLESDSLEDLPASVSDPTQIGCEVLEMELQDSFGDSVGPSAEDSCSFAEVDFADDIQVDLEFANPFDSAGDLFVNFAVRDGEGVRFASGSAYAEAAAIGERFQMSGDSLSHVPGWTDVSDITCEITSIDQF